MNPLSRHRNHPHSAQGQINRMGQRWPNFRIVHCWNSEIIWQGQLRGFHRTYEVGVLWDMKTKGIPYVFLIDPPLEPRDNVEWDAIPHLMYNSDNPERSGLCLYDPDGREWSNHMLIADTTLPWAMKWLFHYELWHYDGIWRGGGVGAESIAQARSQAILGETQEHHLDPKREAPMAIRQTLQDTLT